MEPKLKSDLLAFTTAAKAVIYNEARLQELLPMMGTEDGAVQAVQAVVGSIEQRKPVPPNVAPLLAVNVYMLLVDVANQVTGEEPDEEIIQRVAMTLLQTFRKSHAEGPEQPGEEAVEGDPMQQQEMAAGAEPPEHEQMGRGIIGRRMGV